MGSAASRAPRSRLGHSAVHVGAILALTPVGRWQLTLPPRRRSTATHASILSNVSQLQHPQEEWACQAGEKVPGWVAVTPVAKGCSVLSSGLFSVQLT
jgi:hypothetical protein